MTSRSDDPNRKTVLHKLAEREAQKKADAAKSNADQKLKTNDQPRLRPRERKADYGLSPMGTTGTATRLSDDQLRRNAEIKQRDAAAQRRELHGFRPKELSDEFEKAKTRKL